MKKAAYAKYALILMLAAVFCAGRGDRAMAWSEHEMILMPMLSAMPGVASAKPVKVERIEDFLSASEKDLEKVLADEEAWAVKNMGSYKPLPAALGFKAAGKGNVKARFLDALRLNPGSKFAMYTRLMPGEKTAGRVIMQPRDISLLKDLSSLEGTTYLRLRPGDKVKPIDVLGTATDEPDMGYDLGLFEDSNTPFGARMGFGKQPFGNPKVEYSSQAPFHMGFYHEASIVYMLAGFLKQTYPEYRIHMFRTLSEFAFRTGHDYWGWRFMGLGMHYLTDISMPYHAKPLPGISTMRMLWINLKSMLGFKQAQKDAIQLVSNRHTALEDFQKAAIREAYGRTKLDARMFDKMKPPSVIPGYSDGMPRDLVTKAAVDMAVRTDEELVACMPKSYVSDPSVELTEVPGRDKIIETVRKEKGQKALDSMDMLLGELYAPMAVSGSSYISTILDGSKAAKK